MSDYKGPIYHPTDDRTPICPKTNKPCKCDELCGSDEIGCRINHEESLEDE